jgi:hypothetical protein
MGPKIGDKSNLFEEEEDLDESIDDWLGDE